MSEERYTEDPESNQKNNVFAVVADSSNKGEEEVKGGTNAVQERCKTKEREKRSCRNWICTWKTWGREIETVMKRTAGEMISEDGGQASVRTSNLRE